MARTLRERFECAGERLGIVLNLVYQRGLEMAIGGFSIINGRAALSSDMNERPLAPFLHSALSQLSREPYVWAIALIGIGLLHLIVISVSMFAKGTAARAAMAFIQTALYVAVVTAILTSKEPVMASERYAWNSCLAFLCFVVLTSRTISDRQKKGRVVSG